ncbi:MAG: DegT/DnrJ/EryC1/StrS family aminotransferase [Actinomycetota bacterium]|nr:DegT/DnrJ/EryC1/StrS family aminotransferase [Actinomycetota bacterium]MDP9451820.1 DegT/DnrJ/EryC1/StrS family aminotransferase [Actinomycetota bacterium]
MRQPAALGGPPAFPDGLPFARPYTPPLERVTARLARSYERGILTNGPLVAELEERMAERLRVANVVAVSSCTSGLMLALRHLGGSGTVALPSFTFSASAHAPFWCGLEPTFAECRPDTFQVDVDDLRSRLDGTEVIVATHVFGAPCPAEQLEALAIETGVALVFDAAHALGAQRQGRPVGSFGDAEVFSLSPTKLVVGGEGGLVATDRDDVAEAVQLGRDYGNPGDYDCRFPGLNARMSELHAAVALESLAMLDEHLERRHAAAERYCSGLAGIRGISTQVVDKGDVSTYKDFTITVDAEFGVSRDATRAALAAEGVDTRCYFDPPAHAQQAYGHLPAVTLPVTEAAASRVIALPMFARLPLEAIDAVVGALAAIGYYADQVDARSVA